MTTEAIRWLLTGGMASGKSKVRELLEARGFLTIDADSIGHMVLERNGPAFSAVSARWPGAIRDGEIHRPSLAEIVFSDAGQLEELESMTHPHIFDMIRARVEDVRTPVAVEIPLLSHGLGDEWRRLVVDCRDDIRLQRAILRGMSEKDAKSRMARQPSRSEWLASADVVIPNHGDETELVETVGHLVERFMSA